MNMTVTAERPEAAAKDVVLSVRNLESFYGPIMAIRGCSLDVRERPDSRTVLAPTRRQERRSLKTISGVSWTPRRERSLYQGKKHRSASPDKGWFAWALSTSREGREVFPLLTVPRTLKMGGLNPFGHSRIAEDEEIVTTPISPSSRRPAFAGGRHAVRWTAADAWRSPRG